nr:hypothetical protein [Bacilli bacterium]
EMVLMLYEDNVASGINSPMDQATFDFMKKDIVNSYGKVKAEELTYLYNTGQYDALRDDKKAIDEALASGKRVYDPKPIAPQKVKVKDKSGNVREVEIETAEADNNKIDDKTMRLIRKGELQAKKERRR